VLAAGDAVTPVGATVAGAVDLATLVAPAVAPAAGAVAAALVPAVGDAATVVAPALGDAAPAVGEIAPAGRPASPGVGVAVAGPAVTIEVGCGVGAAAPHATSSGAAPNAQMPSNRRRVKVLSMAKSLPDRCTAVQLTGVTTAVSAAVDASGDPGGAGRGPRQRRRRDRLAV
jgi:hypothetical protein